MSQCVKTEYIYSLSWFSPWPHLPTLYLHPIFQSPILANSWQPWAVTFHSDIWVTWGGLDIRLTAEVLDYSFTSDVTGMVTWSVRPYFLLQWNLSWVKDKCVLSSFMAVFVRAIWSLVIPRYEVLTAEMGKLNQSQCWKRRASLLKEKCEDKEVFFFYWISTFCKNNKNGYFNGEAPRARSSIRENLVVTWPSVRPSAQQENQY